MADYLSAQQTIELTFDSDIEIVTPELEKIQFTNSGEMLLSRPNHIRAHRVGGYADVELFFDGKTVSIFGRNLNGYIQSPAEGSVDQLIVMLTTLLASVGAGGIPSGSFVTLPLIFAAVRLPADALPLLLTIDWFLDRCRTTVNVLGDMTVAVLLDRHEPAGPVEPIGEASGGISPGP